MLDDLITIVVPVYNVEDYINRCVDSILCQTYKNMEIILVDDGSTDSSKSICDAYLDLDKRIKVIHKLNGGLSDARNVGLEASNGEYIIFIDSDDYIEKNMIERLHHLALTNNADISICNLCDCYETGVKNIQNEKKVMVYSDVEALKQAFIGEYYGMSICTKMIKRSIIADHRFIKGKTSEDVFFTPILLLKSKKVVYTTETLYNYWHRSGSITTSPYSPSAMDVITGYKQNVELVKKECPELIDLALFRLYWGYFVTFDRIVVTDNFKQIAEYKEVLTFLKKNWFNITKCKYF